jgi:branched-chain amino acid transport system substrate-binding protein
MNHLARRVATPPAPARAFDPGRPPARPARGLKTILVLAFGLACAGLAQAQLLVGQTTGVTGNSALNVAETTLGAKLWIDAVNARGGVNGSLVELRTLDDRGSATQAQANAKTLVERDQVLALFMIRGTPQNEAVLPLLDRYDIASIAPSSGAMLLNSPVKRHVFNVRNSYQAEAERAIEQLVSMGSTRIAVLKTDDAFGDDCLAGATRGFAKMHIAPAFVEGFDKADPKFDDVAARLKQTSAHAVIILGTASSVVKATRAIRAAGNGATVVTLSNNASEGLVRELGALARGVIVTQVFPGENEITMPMIRDATRLLQARQPGARPSPAMIEGFAAARVLTEALRRAGPHPTRKSVIAALDGMDDFDLGGVKVHYRESDHSGVHYADLSVIDERGRFRR